MQFYIFWHNIYNIQHAEVNVLVHCSGQRENNIRLTSQQLAYHRDNTVHAKKYLNGFKSSLRFLPLEFTPTLQDYFTLQWRHDERDGVPNHQPHDCLLKLLFAHRSKKTPKLRVNSLCEGNSSVTSEFPSQRASNAEMFPFDDVIMTGTDI